MQQLNRSMLARYDIPEHIPARTGAAQFGMGERLLGVVDRLIDAAAPGEIGIACVAPEGGCGGDGADPAALLKAQDGLYTLLVRGYRGEAAVKQEVVVQSVVRVIADDGALAELAAEPGLALGLIDTQSATLAGELRRAARLLAARHRLGLGGLAFICLGAGERCGELTRRALAALAEDCGAAPGYAEWLEGACAFYPALAEGFALRADAKQAALQCAEMNYADGMLHLAEPFVRLTIQAPEAFRRRWPPAGSPEIRVVDELGPALALKRRLYDGGLFAMAAPGWLLGLDTLADCMRDERLRAFVGRTFYDELLAGAGGETAAAYAIECFGRFENPLGGFGILRSCRGLLGRFTGGVLPVIRAWAGENFEPPRGLSFALAATIMLYAGARPGADGRYEVIRGKQAEVLDDDPGALAVFATLSHDMPPEQLAYAVLADRELWDGGDLREIDGLEQRVALDLARLQREPGWLPGGNVRVESGE